MNNLSWGESTKKELSKVKEEVKPKKKIDYKKEIVDLEKILERLNEKYESFAHSKVSNAIVDVTGAIENLKKLEY